MKTNDEMLMEIEDNLHNMQQMERHAWEKYDDTDDNCFLSALTYLGMARDDLARVKKLYTEKF